MVESTDQPLLKPICSQIRNWIGYIAGTAHLSDRVEAPSATNPVPRASSNGSCAGGSRLRTGIWRSAGWSALDRRADVHPPSPDRRNRPFSDIGSTQEIEISCN